MNSPRYARLWPHRLSGFYRCGVGFSSSTDLEDDLRVKLQGRSEARKAVVLNVLRLSTGASDAELAEPLALPVDRPASVCLEIILLRSHRTGESKDLCKFPYL